MSKNGHLIVNACISTITLFVKGDLLFSLGILISASAPDKLEISYKDPQSFNGFSRVIKHRTITHWWPLWCALWYYATPVAILLASVATLNDKSIAMLIAFIQGLALGSLLHILTDSLSPMGVPFLLPFSKYRKRLFLLYSTGKTEWRVIFPLSVLTFAWIFARNNQDLFTPENMNTFYSSINNLTKK